MRHCNEFILVFCSCRASKETTVHRARVVSHKNEWKHEKSIEHKRDFAFFFFRYRIFYFGNARQTPKAAKDEHIDADVRRFFCRSRGKLQQKKFVLSFKIGFVVFEYAPRILLKKKKKISKDKRKWRKKGEDVARTAKRPKFKLIIKYFASNA